MKKIMFVFVLVLVFGVRVSAQTFVESQNELVTTGITPTIDAQVVKSGKKVDLTAWFLVTDKWGEGLLGVSKSLKPWLWVGVVAGIETDRRPWRISPEVWAGKNRVSFYFVTEHGGSGYWYKSTGLVNVTRRIAFGYHTQRFYGTGPMMKVDLGRGLAVWASTADRKARTGLIKTF
ncbi:MAG: hypothetical protein KW788_01465 [Candidatus Doudnabacteria bacterium]|nr:hypothetical protein [Candidatus Doudnabacteria bacterium]